MTRIPLLVLSFLAGTPSLRESLFLDSSPCTDAIDRALAVDTTSEVSRFGLTESFANLRAVLSSPPYPLTAAAKFPSREYLQVSLCSRWEALMTLKHDRSAETERFAQAVYSYQLSSALDSTSAATPAGHFVLFQLLQTTELKILYAKGT